MVEQAQVARDRFAEWLESHKLPFLVWAGVGALLFGSVGWWLAGRPADPDCLPPLELRVLTSPESRAAIASATAAFEVSRSNGQPLRAVAGGPTSARGCRAVHFSVYAATADRVIEGFAHVDTWNADDPASASTGPPGTEPGEGGGQGKGVAKPNTPVRGRAAGAAHEAFDPLSEVGPQPDIWIPDSSAEFALVQQALAPRGLVELSDPTPIAYSPLVLGLPNRVESEWKSKRGDGAMGTSWNDLLAELPTSLKLLLRPGPTTSAAGLLHTVGRYLAANGRLPASSDDVTAMLGDRGKTGAMESQMSAPGYSLEDTSLLLDTLRERFDAQPSKGLDNVGVLVSEKALVDFNETIAPDGGQLAQATGAVGAQRDLDCSSFGSSTSADRLTAHYPKGVPALDHPFVRVNWTAASSARDRVRRGEAIQRFGRWLTSAAGQDQLAQAHYRTLPQARSRTPVEPTTSLLRCPASGANASVRVTPYPRSLPEPRLRQVLRAYEQARSRGRVLVLLDVSPSMRLDGRRAEGTEVVDRALDVLGVNDVFGIWAFPRSDQRLIAHRELIRLGAGRDRVAEGKRKVHGARLGEVSGAALYEVLTDAVRTMRSRPTEGNQVILLITDHGDDKISGRNLEAVQDAFQRTASDQKALRIPILVADVHRPACDLTLQGVASVSSESSACLSASADVAKKLASLLAVVEDGTVAPAASSPETGGTRSPR